MPGGPWLDPDSGQPHDGAPLGILLTEQARLTPDRPAFTLASGGASQTLTFAQFDAASNRRARQLLARGVVAGSRVVLAMPNRAEYLLFTFAAWKIGATPCPVSHRLVAGEFAAILALLDPALVIGEAGLPVAPDRLLDIDAPLPVSDASPRDDCLPPAIATPGKIANSGGSTGRPKLIVDPHPSVWGGDKEGCRRGPRLTLLNPGPLYHSAPFNTTTMALAQGSHIVCMARFDPGQWLALVARHRANYVYLVPTMMARIARLPAAQTQAADLSSIAILLHMAAPCPPEVKRWWIARLGAERVWEVYGGTERIGVTTISGSDWLRHPGSVGRAAAGQKICITGDDGQALPVGEIGEIRFRRGDGAAASYRYIGAESRAAGGSDSFGDMGWLDADGYLYIADRRSDMILVGGVNIYPAQIEAAIERLPGVAGCAVIGLPDADLGNRIHAIVELEPGRPVPDSAAFLESLAPFLDRFRRPRSVEFTTTPIRDEAGKVRRSALRTARIPPPLT